MARDKCSLDLFWLRDESLLDADNLPDPAEIAEEIAEDLRSALWQIEQILSDLQGGEPQALDERRLARLAGPLYEHDRGVAERLQHPRFEMALLHGRPRVTRLWVEINRSMGGIHPPHLVTECGAPRRCGPRRLPPLDVR